MAPSLITSPETTQSLLESLKRNNSGDALLVELLMEMLFIMAEVKRVAVQHKNELFLHSRRGGKLSRLLKRA